MRFEFHTDQDTERLLEIVMHFLQEYFGYGQEQALHLVNDYYTTHKASLDEKGWGDDFYHHEGPFRVAALLHWTESTEQEVEFVYWLRNNGWLQTPPSASLYFRTRYFRR